MVARLAVTLMLLGISPGFAEENAPSDLEQRARSLAERMCAECHAVGERGQSPHAGAPAFRTLEQGRSRFLHGATARRAGSGSSRHADVSLFPRGCPRLRSLSAVPAGTVASRPAGSARCTMSF